MNKEEKKLANKILNHYYSKPDKSINFTDEENIILDRWEALKIINMPAFHHSTSFKDSINVYLRGVGYPFTLLGYQEYKKNWYIQFREGEVVTVIRDILTFIAFSLSLYLALVDAFTK